MSNIFVILGLMGCVAGFVCTINLPVNTGQLVWTVTAILWIAAYITMK